MLIVVTIARRFARLLVRATSEILGSLGLGKSFLYEFGSGMSESCAKEIRFSLINCNAHFL